MVALVGTSGAGKTTLANLVPRFYDVTAGSVQIDGRDVRDLKLSSLREKISIVAQETFLFNDTVFDNIAYGRPDAKTRGSHRGGESGAGGRVHRALAGGLSNAASASAA